MWMAPPPQCDVCQLDHRPRDKVNPFLFQFGVYVCYKQHHCVILTLCSSSVSVLTSVISFYTVISHISCSSGACGGPVNFPHAVLIGPSLTSFLNSLTKKWWRHFICRKMAPPPALSVHGRGFLSERGVRNKNR